MEFAKEVLIRIVATVISVIIISILLDLLVSKQQGATDGTLKKPGCGCGGHTDDNNGTVVPDLNKPKPVLDTFAPPGESLAPVDYASIFNK